MYGCWITIFCKFMQIIFLYSWIGKRHDWIKLCLLICFSNTELFLGHSLRLFGQELRWQSIFPISPISFIWTLIYQTKFPIALFICIPILSTLVGIFNQRTEWIIWIFLNIFKNFQFWNWLRFISIKDYINSWREVAIILVNSHTLDVFLSINHDTNLWIPGFAKWQIWNIAPKFNETILIYTAVFFIPNSKTLRIKAFRIMEFLFEGLSIISWYIILYSLNFIEIVDITMCRSRNTQYSLSSHLISIGCLRKTVTVNLISTFSLQHE